MPHNVIDMSEKVVVITCPLMRSTANKYESRGLSPHSMFYSFANLRVAQ